MTRTRGGRGLVPYWMVLAVAAVVLVAIVLRGGPVGANFLDALPLEVLLQPRFVVPVAAVVLGLPAFSYLLRRRFERYARSLSYAITDRRLLVFEHGKIVEDLPPEQVSRITLRPRGRRHGDVVFGQRRYNGEANRRRDAVLRERDAIGFKALPDAEEMKGRVEAWLEVHRESAVRELEGMAGAIEVESADRPWPVLAARRGGEPERESRRVTHPRLGVSVAFPATWQLQVRRKRKPLGPTFLDAENWRRLEQADDDWNVIRAVGRMNCSVQAEVFETEPTLDFERAVGGRLAAMFAGEVVHSEPRLQIDGVPGFSVTRRRSLNVRSTPGSVVEATRVRVRQSVLHDGRRQVCVESTWPDDMPELERVIDAVERSLRLE